jgi:hypothetical protein
MGLGFDIEPAGVERVLKGLRDPNKRLADAGKTITDGLPNAAKQSQSGIVAKALDDLVKWSEYGLKEISQRVVNSPQAAVDATRAYVEGDHESVRNAQKRASFGNPGGPRPLDDPRP